MVDLHEQLVYPVLIEYTNVAIQRGVPIIRPMWFADNLDPRLLAIDDQFLIDNSILVAPILDPATFERTIYRKDHGSRKERVKSIKVQAR